MKKKSLMESFVIGMVFSVVCSACKVPGRGALAGESEQESLFEVLEDMAYTPEFEIVYSETESYPELAGFLVKYYGIPEEYLTETRYYYNYIDLNGDGIEEIAVAAIGEYTLESGGDAVLLLEKRENGFAVIGSFTGIRTPVIISDSVSNGWRDVIFPVYGGGTEAGYLLCSYTAGIESGGYFEEGQMFADELDVSVSGVQILSNNLIDDMDKGTYLTLAE